MNRALAPAAPAALLLASWPVSAQYDGWTEYHPNKTIFTMGYQMAQPLGSLHDYITAPLFRYADQFAIEAVGHYYIDTGPRSMFQPFLGVGIGGVWANAYQQSVDLGLSQNGFYFIVSPEIGLNIVLARGSTTAALNLAVLYNFTTASYRNVSNAQMIAETIGFSFSY